MNKLVWQLIALMFGLLVVGIVITIDVQKVVGIVILFIALAIGTVARLMRQSERRNS